MSVRISQGMTLGKPSQENTSEKKNSLVLFSLRLDISDFLGKLLECVLVGGVLGLKL